MTVVVLDAANWRALRILADKPAHELVARPLETVLPLIAAGYARRGPDRVELYRGKVWPCRTVTITDAGRTALTHHTPDAGHGERDGG